MNNVTTKVPALFRGLIVPLVLLAAAASDASDDGFEPIFDGATLAGWAGQDMSFWSVEDGAITGTIAPDHAPPMNQYLVWQGGLVEDFELKLDFRLTGSGTPDTNGGFQFRSRRLPDGDVAGYQVDNNFGQPWKVRLYDEFGRHDLAREGERAAFGPDGTRTVEPLPPEAGASDFRLDEWHEYHLTADGPRLTLRVNGRLVAEAVDGDADAFEPRGVLAMQLHTGPPMKAQFRNPRLKPLRPAAPPDSREALLAEAALHWDLGERPDAHQPPLKAEGAMTAGRAPQGAGATGGRVAQLRDAGFDARVDLNRPAAWNVDGTAATVFLRARVPDGNWAAPLLSKGRGDAANVRLFGGPPPAGSEAAGPVIGFEVRTDRGLFAATFPVSAIDPAAWHDLAGRYDGAAVQILCDGKVMAQAAAEGRLLPSAEPLFVGAESAAGAVDRRFSGEMESAAVWTRPLTDLELARLAPPAPN